MFECRYVTRWIWVNYSANDELQCYIYPLSSLSPCVHRRYWLTSINRLLVCFSEEWRTKSEETDSIAAWTEISWFMEVCWGCDVCAAWSFGGTWGENDCSYVYEDRYLLAEIMQGGNFGQYDTRLGSKENEGKLHCYLRMSLRNLRFVKHYPTEALSEPLFRTWFALWKKTHEIR